MRVMIAAIEFYGLIAPNLESASATRMQLKLLRFHEKVVVSFHGIARFPSLGGKSAFQTQILARGVRAAK